MHLKKRPVIHIDSYWTYDEWIHLVESSLGNINILLITSQTIFILMVMTRCLIPLLYDWQLTIS